MIKDILVHIDGSRGGKRRLRYAFDLAGRHGARLTALHVVAPVDVPPYYRPGLIESVVAIAEERSADDAHAAEAIFREVAAQRPDQAVWLAAEGPLAEEIGKQARWCDLVVLGQYEAAGSAERHPSSLAEDIAARCGVPVLVVPCAYEKGEIQRALIAWDGSREAVRAVHDALPLLAGSGTIAEIATAADDAAGPLQPLRDHLHNHGVTVATDTILPVKESAADTLLERIRDGRFDLLVMGWSGRSPWLELLFGGTTLETLARASVPVLISG